MIESEAPESLEALAAQLGHVFAAPGLLVDAITHPSLAGLNRTPASAKRRVPGAAYERLEFLGDRVLGLIVAEWLLERFPEEPEGSLARRHAAMVKRESLAVVAEKIGLGRHLRMSPGEQETGGRSNLTILGDACEAVIGALYLDGGLEVARNFVRASWVGQVEACILPPRDCKTALQEWAQGRGKPLPVYEIVRRSGPAHEPEFEVSVSVEGEPPAPGIGRSRRAAETEAARALLSRIGVEK
ncbi:MAG: ribonuclease III [Rhodospirillaceae bacterium]